jgi:signal transduction histidine kinase
MPYDNHIGQDAGPTTLLAVGVAPPRPEARVGRRAGRVISVPTLGQALDAITESRRTDVDVVLLSLALPDASGTEVLEGFLSEASDIPVVVVVTPDDEELGMHCVTIGAQDYLVLDGGELPPLAWHVAQVAALHWRRERELRNAREEAEEATRLKDKFVALVAHDLRGPLGAIIGLLQVMMLRQDIPLHPTHSENLRFIVDNGAILLDLIEDLLNVSKLQTGKITPVPRFLDAHYLAEIAINKVSLLASQKGIGIRNEIASGSRVFTDGTLFGQVLQNLLSNAIKFSHPGDEVTIFSPPDAPTTVAVRDRGIGIPSRSMSKLFVLEEKVSTEGTAGEKGTGFGLPLSSRTMEALGGLLSVESEEGKGSTFYAALPSVEPRVLVVDDDPVFRRMLGLTLRGIGIEPAIVGNGQEAVDHLAEHGLPHLIVTDVNMPVMDGLRLLRTLKRDARTDRVPIIVVTADANLEIRREVLGLEADDFTVKPLQVEDFIPRVRRFVG